MLLIVVPAALTAADFTYTQVAFKGPISWPGHIHQGFARLAAYLWVTGIREAMDNLVLQQGSDVDNVVITGHSMGAGVGTLLSYTMQVRFSWLLALAMDDVGVASSRSAPYGDRSAEAQPLPLY